VNKLIISNNAVNIISLLQILATTVKKLSQQHRTHNSIKRTLQMHNNNEYYYAE